MEPPAPFDLDLRRAARLADIAPFHVLDVQTAARVLEAAGRDIVHMEIGEPDFPTPPAALAAARAMLDDGRIWYTPAIGLPELRAAIARHYAEDFGVEIAPSRVVVTAGSSAALLLVLSLLVDRDDELLQADPGYPCNRHFVRVLEGRPVGVPVDAASAYQLTTGHVNEHWRERTRGVLVASPSNPTGTTIPPAELADIARVVRERRGFLVVDEIYLGLTYDQDVLGPPRSALSIAAPHLDEFYVVSSFSKYFAMTGWRLGWIVAPEHRVRDLETLAQNLYISPPTLAQRAALACFTPETFALLESQRCELEARRDRLVAALRRLSFGVPVIPRGGLFVYADSSAFDVDSERFCRDALEGAGVAFTPGIDFGVHRASDHVRFAYTLSRERLDEAIARLTRFLAARERDGSRTSGAAR